MFLCRGGVPIEHKDIQTLEVEVYLLEVVTNDIYLKYLKGKHP